MADEPVDPFTLEHAWRVLDDALGTLPDRPEADRAADRMLFFTGAAAVVALLRGAPPDMRDQVLQRLRGELHEQQTRRAPVDG